MPKIQLHHWNVKGSAEGNCTLEYKKEVTLHERVPVEAYQEAEMIFDACMGGTSALCFMKTMLSPSNTKVENRRFKLQAFVTSTWINVPQVENVP